VTGSDIQRVLKFYGASFAKRLTDEAEALTGEVIEAAAREAPELLGPDPRLRPLAVEMFSAHLESTRAAIADRAPLEGLCTPLVVAEYARLLAQLGVSSTSLLLGYQLQRRISTHHLIECGAAVVDSNEDLALLLDVALAYKFAYEDAALDAALSAYGAAPGAAPTSPGVGLSRRVDAVLDGAVTDVAVAERMLGYRLVNHHVAVVAWFDDSFQRPRDMLAAERRLRALPGVREALVAPKDEHTLRCWLSVTDEAAIDEWIAIARETKMGRRLAFGEPGVGIAGFRVSHLQALAAGTVLAAARPEAGSVARYRDVSTISFMVEHPAEARVWVGEILGDLAGTGTERERLRHTLHVFFEEGEDTVATSRRLFVHRNTVKYRLDQAKRSLPHGFTHRRLELALALKYCEWIPAFDGQGV
jgi:DNA-binding PucR family transcriptional regulator